MLQCHSLAVGDKKRYDETVCHSLPVGSRKRYDETAFLKRCNDSLPVGDWKGCDDKMCNVTHKLLLKGKDMMRLPFTKCAISLTPWW
jgi:hypothetical protein